MPIFDYSCKTPTCFASDETVEKLVKKYDDEVLCIVCEQPMKKQLSVPSLGGMDEAGRSQPRDISQ